MKRLLGLAACLTLATSAFSQITLVIPSGVVPAGETIESANMWIMLDIGSPYAPNSVTEMGDGSWELFFAPYPTWGWNYYASQFELTVCGQSQTWQTNALYNTDVPTTVTGAFDPFVCATSDTEDLALGFDLEAAWPNPFNPATTLAFQMAATGQATLSVYNLKGEEVATLVDGRVSQGRHEISWNAAGETSGIYLVRLATEAGVQTRKITLIK